MIERILDIILGNIGLIVFVVFALLGVMRRGEKEEQAAESKPSSMPETEQDHRPLAERLAEAFGVDLEEVTGKKAEPSPPPPVTASRGGYASDGRRGPTSPSVQDEYPDLFGGGSVFADSGRREQPTKYGFDDTEWGSTFEKGENQWGGAFPDKKSSEPVVEWGTKQ